MRRFVQILIFLTVPIVGIGQSYKYPDIPDGVVGELERATYMAEHFWDNADLNDTTLLNDPKVALDFIFLLQLSKETGKTKAILDKTVEKTATSANPLKKLLFWFNRYLHNSESPMYDDELYLEIIETIIQTSAFGDGTEELYELRDLLRRNRIGHGAEDFQFIDTNGKNHHLYDVKAKKTLLIFYNPDCSKCRKAIAEISADSVACALTVMESLKVVAVCPWGDFEERKTAVCPDGWVCGFDKDAVIAAKRLYDIQQLPSMYLLDSDHRVLVKEANNYGIIKRLLTE